MNTNDTPIDNTNSVPPEQPQEQPAPEQRPPTETELFLRRRGGLVFRYRQAEALMHESKIAMHNQALALSKCESQEELSRAHFDAVEGTASIVDILNRLNLGILEIQPKEEPLVKVAKG